DPGGHSTSSTSASQEDAAIRKQRAVSDAGASSANPRTRTLTSTQPSSPGSFSLTMNTSTPSLCDSDQPTSSLFHPRWRVSCRAPSFRPFPTRPGVRKVVVGPKGDGMSGGHAHYVVVDGAG